MQEQAERIESAVGKANLSWRGVAVAVVLGVVLLLLVDVAVRYTELITGRYLTSGVPPIPAFAAILLLVGLRPLLRRLHPRLALDGRQILLVFLILAVGIWLGGSYGVRAFLPHLVALQYWSESDRNLAPYVPYLPEWAVPHDPDLIRKYYEGSREGIVPWGVWIPILLRWAPLFLALFVGPLCLLLLFRRQWLHAERLSFPLLTLPLALATDGGSRYAGGKRSLFRHPLLWLGIGVAAAFNLLNIGRALFPSIPAPGFYRPLWEFFPNRPWTPLQSINLFFMLETIGFGYFIPLEVSFSAWFLYLMEKVVAIGGIMAGHEQAGFPFLQEQSAGAYLACALLLVWGARRQLAATWRAALRRGGEERLAWAGVFLSVGVLVTWMAVAGLAVQVALPFVLMLGCFVLVCARIRAETGMPAEFVYPYALPKEMVVNAFSVPGITALGGVRSMVVFSSLAWMSRHHLAEMMAAWQVDSLKVADQERIGRRTVALALLVAFAVGLVGGVWLHLHGYYQIGSNPSQGGAGEYRALVAQQEYQQMASRLLAPPPRDWSRLGGNGAGFLVALLLAWGRTHIPAFPLHPLGYILATAYGDHTTNFFPLLTAWLLKASILKLGGLKAYRAGMPFFLGLIIGHFTLGGIIWPLLSLLISPEASNSYHIYFGG
ncbi:MAG: hypothetical protein GX774_16950 [Armatimonadetes bacterium]|nr:hypothetical protein [Armatimonadota bacterium]